MADETEDRARELRARLELLEQRVRLELQERLHEHARDLLENHARECARLARELPEGPLRSAFEAWCQASLSHLAEGLERLTTVPS